MPCKWLKSHKKGRVKKPSLIDFGDILAYKVAMSITKR